MRLEAWYTAQVDPELKQLLAENLELSKQNNKMLRAMRRDAWIGLIWRVIFWAIVFLAPLYFYQNYLAPLVAQYQAAFPEGSSPAPGLFGLPSFAEIQKLVDSYRSSQ